MGVGVRVASVMVSSMLSLRIDAQIQGPLPDAVPIGSFRPIPLEARAAPHTARDEGSREDLGRSDRGCRTTEEATMGLAMAATRALGRGAVDAVAAAAVCSHAVGDVARRREVAHALGLSLPPPPPSVGRAGLPPRPRSG